MTTTKKIYENYSPAGQEAGLLPIVEDSTVLEIGFGSGALLDELKKKNNDVYGVDVSKDIVTKAQDRGFDNLCLVDVSDEPLPYKIDFFDAVYCFEVFEHVTNPHRLFSEIRRILKAGSHLYFSVPTQEQTMGYGPNRHSFVYPGLLEKNNLERFFMQMYFKITDYSENNTGIIYHRNYILKNLKNLCLPDIVEVIIGDYSVIQLYGKILSKECLKEEIEREIEPYMANLAIIAKEKKWDLFNQTVHIILPYYYDYYPLYMKLVELLLANENITDAKKLLNQLCAIPSLPEIIRTRTSAIINTL